MESPEMKYGHLFMDGEDQYLFIRVLGSGADAIAQLVLHVQTGELVVRKVERRLLDDEQIEEEDPERILFSLQSQARTRGVQPNIARLQSADDVPAPRGRGGQQLLYHRVKYFDFYNGGTLEDFWGACETRGLAPPPSLVLAMVQDLSQALNFMYSMQPFVIHGDLHWGNVFLHWGKDTSTGPRFFLGDFGRSTCGRARAGTYFGLVADSELNQYLEEVIEPELNSLAHGPATELPNFTRLQELLSAAPAANAQDMRPFMFTPEFHSTPSPLLHNTWYEAREARGIHGPWHVAEVSINPSTGKLTINSESHHTYHRPHSICVGYETESEDDCANMV